MTAPSGVPIRTSPPNIGLATLAFVISATHAETPTAVPDAAASYSVGLSLATQWREQGLATGLDEPSLLRGIHDGLAATALTLEDRTRAGAYLRTAYGALGARNKAAADEFLAHNGREPGVMTTASGLQYLVLTPGDSAATAPGAGDPVTIQYRGRLLDGTEFDSSFARGKPAVVHPNALIPGLREALGLMSRGAKWRVFIPPELAYAASPPPVIPVNSALVFELELMSSKTIAAPGTGAH